MNDDNNPSPRSPGDADYRTEAAPALQLRAEKYLDDLNEFDISEAQKLELLATLWSIMRMLVEMGFSLDVCGQLIEEANEFFGEESDLLELHRSSDNGPEGGDDDRQ